MPEQNPLSGPNADKRMITALNLGTEVDEIFIIAAAQQGQARNGPYWRIEFRDASGNISGKIWSPQSQSFPELPPGTFVAVKGRVISYRDQLELSVEHMRILSDEEKSQIDLSLFMLSSPYRPEDMMQELLDLADKHLVHMPWRRLVRGVLMDGEIGMALRMAPAAKTMHHAYTGGLLEHTLSVTRLCMRLADQYPRLDRQALFAGAVCHDLGKLWELSAGIVVEYSQAGKLLGHIFLFLERLNPFISRAALEPELAEHLKHLILSHHGSYEFGSPRLPATPEAFALHYADILDAKMQQVEKVLDGMEEQSWSPYLPSLERSLFKPIRSPEKNAPKDIDSLVNEIDAGFLPEETLPFSPFETMHAAERKRGQSGQSGPDASQTEKQPESGQNSQHLPLFSQCSLPSKE